MDAVDEQILSLLSRNARLSLVELGSRVSLSPPAVKRRIERLERQGTIRGYRAVLDEGRLGAGTEAFVEVYCASDTSLETLRQSLTVHPAVIGAYTVAGDADAILHLRTGSIADLERAIEQVHSEPSVVRTRTQVVLTRLAERDGLLD